MVLKGFDKFRSVTKQQRNCYRSKGISGGENTSFINFADFYDGVLVLKLDIKQHPALDSDENQKSPMSFASYTCELYFASYTRDIFQIFPSRFPNDEVRGGGTGHNRSPTDRAFIIRHDSVSVVGFAIFGPTKPRSKLSIEFRFDGNWNW